MTGRASARATVTRSRVGETAPVVGTAVEDLFAE
jgi:hypothetical protein